MAPRVTSRAAAMAGGRLGGVGGEHVGEGGGGGGGRGRGGFAGAEGVLGEGQRVLLQVQAALRADAGAAEGGVLPGMRGGRDEENWGRKGQRGGAREEPDGLRAVVRGQGRPRASVRNRVRAEKPPT